MIFSLKPVHGYFNWYVSYPSSYLLIWVFTLIEVPVSFNEDTWYPLSVNVVTGKPNSLEEAFLLGGQKDRKYKYKVVDLSRTFLQ